LIKLIFEYMNTWNGALVGSKVDNCIFMHSLYDYKYICIKMANKANFTDKCNIFIAQYSSNRWFFGLIKSNSWNSSPN